MVRKFVAIFLLVQQAVWLLVLLPGHQRGAMVVAGSERAVGGGGGGCCGEAAGPVEAPSCHAPAHADGSGEQPAKESSDRTSRCAVCHVAVRMLAATPPDFRPPALELMDVLPPDAPSERPSLQISPTYLACGPPAA